MKLTDGQTSPNEARRSSSCIQFAGPDNGCWHCLSRQTESRPSVQFRAQWRWSTVQGPIASLDGRRKRETCGNTYRSSSTSGGKKKQGRYKRIQATARAPFRVSQLRRLYAHGPTFVCSTQSHSNFLSDLPTFVCPVLKRQPVRSTEDSVSAPLEAFR
jgi:hypothetical protein